MEGLVGLWDVFRGDREVIVVLIILCFWCRFGVFGYNGISDRGVWFFECC